MSDKDDATLDLYVAAYREPATAEEDWNTLKGLAADDVIKVGALALVNRDHNGKLHVKDTTNEPGIGAVVVCDRRAAELLGYVRQGASRLRRRLVDPSRLFPERVAVPRPWRCDRPVGE